MEISAFEHSVAELEKSILSPENDDLRVVKRQGMNKEKQVTGCYRRWTETHVNLKNYNGEK